MARKPLRVRPTKKKLGKERLGNIRRAVEQGGKINLDTASNTTLTMIGLKSPDKKYASAARKKLLARYPKPRRK